jgi:hypothetical protein
VNDDDASDTSKEKLDLFNPFLNEAPCPRCGDPNDDPFHLFCECLHALVVARREQFHLSFLALLEQLMLVIRNAIDNEHVDLDTSSAIYEDTALVGRLCDNSPQLNKEDYNFVLFHMLLAMPFSAKIAEVNNILGTGIKLPLTTALGRIFHATVLRSRWLRPLNNMMVAWAAKWTKDFASLRRELLSAQPQA